MTLIFVSNVFYFLTFFFVRCASRFVLPVSAYSSYHYLSGSAKNTAGKMASNIEGVGAFGLHLDFRKNRLEDLRYALGQGLLVGVNGDFRSLGRFVGRRDAGEFRDFTRAGFLVQSLRIAFLTDLDRA